MHKTLLVPLLAMAALPAAILTAASPASAAPSAARPTTATVAAANPAATASGVTTFIKAFADSKSVSNDAAFGNDVFPTSDGGYVVTGPVGVSPHNGWVAKLSAAGQVHWQERLGSGEADFHSVQQTSDGGYILAGDTGNEAKCTANGFATSCAWVVKLGPVGAVQWQRVYPGAGQALAAQVEQTRDGGYIVAGNTTDSSGTVHAWLAKLGPAGALVWQRQFGLALFAAAFSVAQTADGGYITSGTSGVINNSSVLVAKFGSAGTVQWQKAYGTGNEDTGNSVQQTSDGGYIVGGDVVTQNPDTSRPGEALLLKLTPAGAIQFQDVFNAGISQDLSSTGASVRQTPDGGYILAGANGFQQSTGPVEASWLAKTTSTGALSWQHVFAGPSHFSEFASVRLTSDGGYIAAGTTDAFAHSDNFWLVKTDSNGNVAAGGCTGQRAGTTIEQPAALTATTTSFPSVTPPNNPPAATADPPSTTNLVTESVC